MFENINPMDRPTAYLEIGILLLISFLLGYLCAKIKIKGDTKFSLSGTKNNVVLPDEDFEERDIITEPTTIKAVLTRDRQGKPVTNSEEEE